MNRFWRLNWWAFALGAALPIPVIMIIAKQPPWVSIIITLVALCFAVIKTIRSRRMLYGYTACWKQTTHGNCRMPQNHKGDCV